MNYSDKLRDPRWQKKRLEVFQRDNFTCQKCGDSQTTLSVHHRRYIWPLDPWEYDNSSLVTLCEPCHEHEKEAMDEALASLFDQVRDNFLSDEVRLIAQAINYGLDSQEGSNLLKKLLMERARLRIVK